MLATVRPTKPVKSAQKVTFFRPVKACARIRTTAMSWWVYWNIPADVIYLGKKVATTQKQWSQLGDRLRTVVDSHKEVSGCTAHGRYANTFWSHVCQSMPTCGRERQWEDNSDILNMRLWRMSNVLGVSLRPWVGHILQWELVTN